MTSPLRLATYNVHGWVGRDGLHRPSRVMEVLAGLQADILALQEATLPVSGGPEQAQRFLQEHTGLHVALGFTMRRKDAHFGNILLSRLPLVSLRSHDLSFGGLEPRGLIEAVVEHKGHRLQVLATHLGLRSRERLRQAGRILEIADTEKYEAALLLGDCNEWLPWGRALRCLARGFAPAPRHRTFPSWLPLFALDRIMVMGQGSLQQVQAQDWEAARRASDHLPLTAELWLG